MRDTAKGRTKEANNKVKYLSKIRNIYLEEIRLNKSETKTETKRRQGLQGQHN